MRFGSCTGERRDIRDLLGLGARSVVGREDERGRLEVVDRQEKRILLVLDVNGFLVDTRFVAEGKLKEREEDAVVNKFWVYDRPHVREFVQFCLDHFFVGVWSSSRRHNLMGLVQHIFRDAVGQLAFIWVESMLPHESLQIKTLSWPDSMGLWL
ncbi:hypothetical protein CBR_g40214 [Chara braunii]|uniref:Mitochondrial import inner membrane translocase subunit TIM50 n=1 Tax=Chara braunii TaxID=69332 RepID=A0A388LTD0_CHABU|nr:hypothetical protein CBR_g40214 [Chara braunii]|eukprot:GBG85576.1 hypothetical protein CBR_g40214 [Chara braunii]